MADGNGWRLADRYLVLDRLGAGSMAEVFRAHDEQLDRDVAVKVFHGVIEEPGTGDTPERRERELHALAQLSHPHLITLYDASAPGANPSFLVTELVRGPSLAARLADGPLPEALARLVGAQIADALAYVHALGMVHRDVKPANILLGSAGPDGSDPETAGIRARLSDFGIVRLVNSARLTAADFTLGTASYLAPEQARGSAVDSAADIYALGLVLLEALTGRRSFTGSVHEALAARLSQPPEIPPDLPPPWPGLLAAMTAADPALRPTAAEVAATLRAETVAPVAPIIPPPALIPEPQPALASFGPAVGPAVAAGVVAEPPLGLSDEPPARRHNPAGIAAAGLACAAIVAAGAVLLLRPAGQPEVGPGSGQTVPGQSSVQSSGPHRGATNNPVAVVNEGTSPPSDARSGPSQRDSSSASSSSAGPSRGASSSSSSAPVRSSSSASSSGQSSSASQSASSSTSSSAAQSSSASQSPSPPQSSSTSQSPSPSPSPSSSTSSSSSASSSSAAPPAG